jgi:acetolactate synthase small subunit
MRTFVVYLRRNPESLPWVVLMLHRRVGQIDRLTAERMDNRDVMRVSIGVEADAERATRIEANLYNLVDVLLVENTDHAGARGLSGDLSSLDAASST